MSALILGVLTAGAILVTTKLGRANTKQPLPIRVQKDKRSR